MAVNIIKGAKIYSVGGKELSQQELGLISDSSTASGIDISMGEDVDLVVDLSAPYDVDTLTYYRNSADVETITLEGRQNQDTNWITLQISFSGQEVISDLLSSENKYQFFRIKHSVSAGSAEALELEIISKEETAFGEDGQKSETSVNAGTEDPDFIPIEIYNSTGKGRYFYFLLDARSQYSDIISAATTNSGTYYHLYEKGINLPDTFSFSSGQHLDTQEYNGEVILDATTTSGTYYSPVIDISSVESVRIFWDISISGTNKVDVLDSVDSVNTVGIRLSNTSPSDVSWSSGQMSTDSNWHVESGSIEFVPYANNQILSKIKPDYIQFKVEMHSPSPGQTPILKKLGAEEAQKVYVNKNDSADVYILSDVVEHTPNRESSLLCWFYGD